MPSSDARDVPQDSEVVTISDEESSTSLSPKMQATPKFNSFHDVYLRLKRRKINVAGAPKMPLTGYVRYMNDRREILRKEQPEKSAIEHTKIIGEEWHRLSEDRKTPYMKAAEEDRQRYLSELHNFLRAHPEVLADEMAQSKVRKSIGERKKEKSALKEKSGTSENVNLSKESVKKRTSPPLEENSPPSQTVPTIAQSPLQSATQTPPVLTPADLDQTRKRKRISAINIASSLNASNSSAPIFGSNSATSTNMPNEIQIFTNEFLDHNKMCDMELRTLRKNKSDLEQQNAVLEKHVENMKTGVEKLKSENSELIEMNRLLEAYLSKTKSKLAHSLSGLSIPTEQNGASLLNIDKYMADLYKMATSNTHGPASLNKAKDIIRKLDLNHNF